LAKIAGRAGDLRSAPQQLQHLLRQLLNQTQQRKQE
jgi:hypothetical protein